MAASEDTPLNRFVTFAVTVVLFGGFGLATGAILWIGGDDAWTNLELPAAQARAEKLEIFRSSLPAPVEIDASTAIAVLGDGKPVKSEILVPGSPTALEQALNPAEQKHDPAESELLDL